MTQSTNAYQCSGALVLLGSDTIPHGSVCSNCHSLQLPTDTSSPFAFVLQVIVGTIARSSSSLSLTMINETILHTNDFGVRIQRRAVLLYCTYSFVPTQLTHVQQRILCVVAAAAMGTRRVPGTVECGRSSWSSSKKKIRTIFDGHQSVRHTTYVTHIQIIR